MKKRFFLFLLLISVVLLSSGKFYSQDCMSEVKEIFRRLNISKSEDKQKGYFIDYSIKVVHKDKEDGESQTRVKTFATQGYLALISDMMEVYKDPTNTYMVAPKSKAIYWSNSSAEDDSIFSSMNVGVLREKFLDESRIAECKEVTGDIKFNKIIVVEAGQDAQKKYGIQRMKLWTDTQKKIFYKVLVSYGKDSKYESVEVVFNTIDFNYNKSKIIQSSKSKIFNSDGSMIAKYKGYKLMDIRKNKN